MAISDVAALDAIEVAAMADFFRAAPRHLRVAHDIEVRTLPEATLLLSRGIEPGVLFRRVAGLGASHAVTGAGLDAVLAPMRALRASFAVAMAPGADTGLLAGMLQERGLQPGYAWMKFRRDCLPVPEVQTDLDIRTVGPECAVPFGTVIQEGFGLQPAIVPWAGSLVGRPGWCCVMAFDGATPVAAGAVFIQGEHAWLGLGATLASHRRRGAQSGLLAHRLREVASHGARAAVTETGERLPDKPGNSYRNIVRSGFTEACLRQNYMAPAAG